MRAGRLAPAWRSCPSPGPTPSAIDGENWRQNMISSNGCRVRGEFDQRRHRRQRGDRAEAISSARTGRLAGRFHGAAIGQPARDQALPGTRGPTIWRAMEAELPAVRQRCRAPRWRRPLFAVAAAAAERRRLLRADRCGGLDAVDPAVPPCLLRRCDVVMLAVAGWVRVSFASPATATARARLPRSDRRCWPIVE